MDSLISQWQNVDIGELMGNKDADRQRNRDENHSNKRNHDAMEEEDDDDDDQREERETPVKNADVSNGDWNSNDPPEKYSAKEQRSRAKLTSKMGTLSKTKITLVFFNSRCFCRRSVGEKRKGRRLRIDGKTRGNE